MKTRFATLIAAAFFAGLGCAQGDDAPLEGCAGLSKKVFDCEVYPEDFYEQTSEAEYEKWCEADSQETVVACLLECDTSADCEAFNECFLGCNE